MKIRFENPIWTAAIFVAAIIVGIAVSTRGFSVGAASPPGERPPLVLEPKAKLKTEPAAWTFAPDIPPPITRLEQRRVAVNWEIKEKQAEIAPGVTYDDYWGFEGRVPGPILRVREGDLVEVRLKNGISSKNGHNIDFHFVMGPGGGAAALNVAPGETAVLEARAMAPGFYMFHCASPDIPTHIANGMYGFVLVQPAEGLPKVDKEWYVVQSEIYTRNGDPGHQSFSIERGNSADAQYVVFNGAVGSLMGDKALRASVGETIRLYVGNAGPNFVSSFHVIGQIFDKVYREGDLISAPARSLQTTLIPAGGSAVVEFKPLVPGNFMLVDHAIFRLHQGAVGSIAISGEQAAEIFHPISADEATLAADPHSEAMQAGNHTHAQAVPPASDGIHHASGTAPAAPTLAAAPLAAPPLTPRAAARVEEPRSSVPPQVVSGNKVTIRILPNAGNFDTNPNNDYSPKALVVKRGATVTWVNGDPAVLHDITADQGQFGSKLLKPSQNWSYTFSKAGTYTYKCVPHPWMKGTIIVK